MYPFQPNQSTANSTLQAPGQAYHIPKARDIICGRRGKGYSKHPGNKSFSEWIRTHLDSYIDAESRSERTLVVANLVNVLRRNDIKFLKFDQKAKQFVELSWEQAHNKVGHAIRDMIKQTGHRSASVAAPAPKPRTSKSSIKKKEARRYSDPSRSHPKPLVRASTISDSSSWPPKMPGVVKRSTSCPNSLLLRTKTSATEAKKHEQTETSLGDETSELPSVLFGLGDDVEKLDTLESLWHEEIGSAAPVASLPARFPDQQDWEQVDNVRDTVNPEPDWTDSHVISSSHPLAPLPLDFETHFDADDMSVVRDILEE